MTRLERIKKLNPQPVHEYLMPGVTYYHLKPDELSYLISRIEKLEGALKPAAYALGEFMEEDCQELSKMLYEALEETAGEDGGI